MTRLKEAILIATLLLLTAGGIPADEATTEPQADKNATISDQHSVRDIPCNWSGWKNSFPEVRCSRGRCDRQREVLKIKCMDGVVTEMKASRVCAGCIQF